MSDLTMLVIFAAIVVVMVAGAEFVRVQCRRQLAEVAAQLRESAPVDTVRRERVG